MRFFSVAIAATVCMAAYAAAASPQEASNHTMPVLVKDVKAV